MGRVRTHAVTILPTTLHLTALSRLVAPTPMMAVVMVWVVEIGIPKTLATVMTLAAVVWAAKPWMGCILTILPPKVLMMRRPPMAVPQAMVRAQMILIQVATSNLGVCRNWSEGEMSLKVPEPVAMNKVRARMPMVFWASFMPWLKAMPAAAAIWALPKTTLTMSGRNARRVHSSKPM